MNSGNNQEPESMKRRNFIVLCHDVSEEVSRGSFAPDNLLEGRVDVLCRCVTSALYVSNNLRRDTSIWFLLSPWGYSVQVDGDAVSGLNPDEKTVSLMLQRCLQVQDFQDFEAFEAFHLKFLMDDNQSPSIKSGRLAKSSRNQQEADERRIKRLKGMIRKGVTVHEGKVFAPPGFTFHREDSLLARIESLRATTNDVYVLQENGRFVRDLLDSKSSLSGTSQGSGVFIIGDQIGFSAEEV